MLSFFDINKKAFINISSDNRIHLFDLESGKEKHSFVERDHLSHQYTCVAWSRSGSASSSNSNSNSSSAVSKYGCLAIGTSDSKVVVFDMDRGVVKSTFDIDSAPVDICYASAGNCFYLASSGSSFVQKINSSNGSILSTIKAGKRAILKVKSHPTVESTVACANSAIRICSAANDDSSTSDVNSSFLGRSSGGGGKGIDSDYTYKKDKKQAVLMKINTSFPGGITVIEYSSCGKYLACCGIGSKELLIYSLEDNKVDNEKKAGGGDEDWNEEVSRDCVPISVVALDQVPKSISSFQTTVTKGHSEQVSMLFLFVIMENDSACVVKANGIANSTQTFDASVIKLSGSKVAVLGGSLGSVSNPKSVTTITVALGHYKRPYFQELSLTSDGMYLSSINLPTQASSSSSAASSSSNPSFSTNVHESVQVLGPLDAGLIKRPHVNIEGDNSNHSNSSAGPESKKTKNSTNFSGHTGNKFDAYSQILEQRLDNISSQLGAWNNNPSISAALKSVQPSRRLSESTDDVVASPDSLRFAIEQALQSGDSLLLDKSIFFTSSLNSFDGSTSKLIIENTCKSLSTGKIVQFLKRLVSKFENHPSFGDVLTYWLASIIKYHCNYLAANVPDLNRQLGGNFSTLIEQRLTTHNRFSSLAGRVDLLLAQSSAGEEK